MSLPHYISSAAWLESAWLLALGTAVIVGSAALIARTIGSTVWRRTIWQVTTLGLLAWVLLEWTGTGPALVWLWRPRMKTAGSAENLAESTENASSLSSHSLLERAGVRASAAENAQTPSASHATALTLALSQRERGLDAALGAGLPPALGTGLPTPPNESTEGLTPTWRTPVEPSGSVSSLATALANAPGLLSRGPVAPAADNRQCTNDIHASVTAQDWSAESSRNPWPALLWALGAAVVVVRVGWARVLLLAFRWRCAAVDDQAMRRRVDVLARRLGMWRPVRLLASDWLGAPVAFGSVFPTIVLPVTFESDFDGPQQEAMLAHELAHLAAGDPAWQLLAGLLCAALWWHPLAWWSRHCLWAASEAAADEASLLVPGGPGVLAAGLVALGRRLSHPRRLGWLSVEGRGFRSSLGRRVERLLNLRAGSWRAPGRGRLLAAKTAAPIVLVLMAISCTAWARPQAPFNDEGGTAMSVLRTSWRSSLAATALWALLSPGPVSATADDASAEKTPPAATEEPQAKKPSGRPQVELEIDLGKGREAKEGDAREGRGRERPRDEAREGRRDRAEGGPPPEEMMRHRRELEQKALEIKRRLDVLGGNHMVRPRQTLDEPPPAERERIEKRKIEEQFEKILQEIREIPPGPGAQGGPGPRPGMGPMSPPSPEAKEEMQRAAKHLQEAAENLRAAGFGAEADRFVQMAERLKRGEAAGLGRPGPGGGMGFGMSWGGGGGGRLGPEGRPGAGPAPGGPAPGDAANPAAAAALKKKVSLAPPYPQSYPGASTDKISVQYAVKALSEQVGLPYELDTSLKNTGPISTRWIEPNIHDQPLDLALQSILAPLGLTYEIRGGSVLLRPALPPGPAGPVPPGAPPGPGGPMPPGGMPGMQQPLPPDVARAVKELGDEVQQMHRDMQELREQLKKLLEREHGEKR